MKILAPSILTSDFSKIGDEISLIEQGGADWIHCDVMDGNFVPNITFGPIVVKAIKKSTKLIIDSHLMIKKPSEYLETFAKAGSDYITIHQEAEIHLNKALNRIKELGCKAGISINPATPISSIYETLDIVDLVLIMSVNPGFGGQKFLVSSLKKIEELKSIKIKNSHSFIIQVDGGLNKDNLESVAKAGCESFVIGSAIFDGKNILENAKDFKRILSKLN